VQQHGRPLPRDGNICLARVPTITAQEVTMSKIGAPKRVIEIEPIEEPAAEPAKVPEPATVPERV